MAVRAITLLSALLLVGLAACDDEDATSAAKKKSANAAASSTAVSQHDPCSFLTASEVETAMGPLAGPPYRAGGGATPQANGGDCRYEAPDRRSIRVSVAWNGGAQFFSMMRSMQGVVTQAGLGELKLLDGTTIAGAWDEARVSQCCEFNALHGDQVVTVDVAGSRATLRQAASLADAAVRRLGQPLQTGGAAGLQPAQERAAQRPRPRSVCDLVTRADAEAIVGTSLIGPPKGNEQSCRYEWPNDALGSSNRIDLRVQWRGGFSELRETSLAVGNAASMIGLGRSSSQATPDRDQGPWDEFSQSIIGVSAAKNDVMVSVEGGPLQQDLQRAFVTRAIINLTR